MSTQIASPPDLVVRGQEVWEGYQREHDVSHLKGQVAAIDPDSRRVWIDPDELKLIDRVRAEGCSSPVYLIRVGYDYLYTKGRR